MVENYTLFTQNLVSFPSTAYLTSLSKPNKNAELLAKLLCLVKDYPKDTVNQLVRLFFITKILCKINNCEIEDIGLDEYNVVNIFIRKCNMNSWEKIEREIDIYARESNILETRSYFSVICSDEFET